MELPELVDRRLDERPRSTVALDGEDVAVFTADRTLVYRGDSLLRDASIETYGHDIERLTASTGRGETTFVLEYVSGRKELTVPEGHAEAVLERLLHGILETGDVLDSNERVQGVYLFSDLTVVVTDSRLVKHVGPAVWESDSETYPFGAVTGLDFEEGDVATQVVLWVDGRAERIKAPSEEAPLLRRTLTRTLCAFHNVDSLEQLNERLEADTDDPAPHSSIALEEEISPLIETTDEQENTGTDAIGAVTDDGWLEPDDTDRPEPADNGDTRSAVSVSDRAGDNELGERIDALERQVSELARTVDRQNELLERQSRHLSALAERVDTDR
jgi:hypothetical protein